VLLAIFPSIALGLLNGLYLPALAQSTPILYWLADGFQFALVPAAAFWLLTVVGGLRPKDYGFGPIDSSFLQALGLIVFVTLLYWLAYEPVRAIAHYFFWFTEASIPFAEALPATQPWRWLLVLYACLTAAFVEEPVFRSLPWHYFSEYCSSPQVPYVLWTSSLFAAIHWEQGIPGLIAAGALGVVAAVTYTKVLNVWPFVAAHFVTDAWNFPWL
jgi:membrane protease YdiL (CAAX protease family)